MKNKRSEPFIGLAGNIGVGKTTFTKIMSERCGWKPFYESVSDNPKQIHKKASSHILSLIHI